MIAGFFLSSLLLAGIKGSSELNKTYYTLIEETANLVPSKTSSVLTSVLWPDYSQSNSVLVDISSLIRCSFEAKKTGATAFAFEDETCSLFGSAGGTPGQVSVYQTLLFPLGDSLEEVARGKLTDSSAAFTQETTSDKAVDGSISDDTQYHSSFLVKPWWRVDLEEERLIYQIQIFPRQSAYERFHDIEVRVGKTPAENGNFSSYSLLCTYPKTYELSEGHLLCSRYNGFIGRFVSIQITATAAEYLQLNDISVYALKK